MPEEKQKSRPFYTPREKVGLYTLGVLAAFIMVGLAPCYFSFEGEKLIYPKLNFAGLIVMLILPASASLIFGLCRQISNQTIWQHCQEAWEKFFAHMPLAALIAFFYSSGQGYMSPKATVVFDLVWIAATIGVYYFNQFLRQICQAEDYKRQS